MKRFLTASDLKTWEDEVVDTALEFPLEVKSPYEPDEKINRKVCIYHGDICRLKIDAIVNAANEGLEGCRTPGHCIDSAICLGAGSDMFRYCARLHGCETGRAKISPGFDLPSKYVLHTVGPRVRSFKDEAVRERARSQLESCYLECFGLAQRYQLRTVAFCCISTGVFGYPKEPAALVALKTVRDWLQEHADEVDLIIFCVYTDEDNAIYHRLMPQFFPWPLGPTAEEKRDV